MFQRRQKEFYAGVKKAKAEKAGQDAAAAANRQAQLAEAELARIKKVSIHPQFISHEHSTFLPHISPLHSLFIPLSMYSLPFTSGSKQC